MTKKKKLKNAPYRSKIQIAEKGKSRAKPQKNHLTGRLLTHLKPFLKILDSRNKLIGEMMRQGWIRKEIVSSNQNQKMIFESLLLHLTSRYILIRVIEMSMIITIFG